MKKVTTKEFIKKVKGLGFKVDHRIIGGVFCGLTGGEIVISNDKNTLVVIWPKCQYAISTMKYGFHTGEWSLDKLYELCFVYASTPIAERHLEEIIEIHNEILNKGDRK